VAGQQATTLKTITDACGQDLRQARSNIVDGCRSSWSSSSSSSPSPTRRSPSVCNSCTCELMWETERLTGRRCAARRRVRGHVMWRSCQCRQLGLPASHTSCCVALLLGHSRLLGLEPRDPPVRPSCSTTRGCRWFRWEVDPSSISRCINSSLNYKLDNTHVSSVGSLLQQTCCCSPLAAWRCEEED
jgi:hypothetical protein